LSASHSLSLGSTADSGSGGGGSAGELSESLLLLGVAEELDSLDSLGSLVGLADVHNGGSGVALGVGLSLGDSVLAGLLQGNGESSSEILLSLVLTHRHANLVVHLGSAVETVE
jgi:hypothetical protein